MATICVAKKALISFAVTAPFSQCRGSVFIAPAYSRVRSRSSNFRPSVRSFVRSSTFTSKFSFLDIRDSCESETLHSNCP